MADGTHPIDEEVFAERETMVFQWAHGRVPVAFCLLGGYLGAGLDRARLVGLHRLVIAAAALANAGLPLTRDRLMALASTHSGADGAS